MKKWIKENSSKLIIAVVVSAVLTAAYFSGEKQDSPNNNKKTETSAAVSAVVSETENTPPESSVLAVSEPQETSAEEHISSEPISSPKIDSQPESSVFAASEAQEPSVEENTSYDPVPSAEIITQPETSAASDISENSIEYSTNNEQSPVPHEQSTTQTTEPENICTMYISCRTALTNEKLNKKTRALLPDDGFILPSENISFTDGESVFDILKRVCREKNIRMEFSIVPLTGGAYIEGIGNLYEFDCGSVSGWMYSVNGEFKSIGCSECLVSDGDSIEWQYSCDLGNDIGNYFYG